MLGLLSLLGMLGGKGPKMKFGTKDLTWAVPGLLGLVSGQNGQKFAGSLISRKLQEKGADAERDYQIKQQQEALDPTRTGTKTDPGKQLAGMGAVRPKVLEIAEKAGITDTRGFFRMLKQFPMERRIAEAQAYANRRLGPYFPEGESFPLGPVLPPGGEFGKFRKPGKRQRRSERRSNDF